jgi:hypothetical protein
MMFLMGGGRMTDLQTSIARVVDQAALILAR